MASSDIVTYKLHDDHASQLRNQLQETLEQGNLLDDPEDIPDILDYTIAMLTNLKTVQYIEDELKDLSNATAAQRIASVVATFFRQLEKEEVMSNGHHEEDQAEGGGGTETDGSRIRSIKSSTEGNALTMAGALGSSRERKPKQASNNKSKEPKPDRSKNRGEHGGKNDRRDRGGGGGRGGSRESRNSGRGGRGQGRGGRGDDTEAKSRSSQGKNDHDGPTDRRSASFNRLTNSDTRDRRGGRGGRGSASDRRGRVGSGRGRGEENWRGGGRGSGDGRENRLSGARRGRDDMDREQDFISTDRSPRRGRGGGGRGDGMRGGGGRESRGRGGRDGGRFGSPAEEAWAGGWEADRGPDAKRRRFEHQHHGVKGRGRSGRIGGRGFPHAPQDGFNHEGEGGWDDGFDGNNFHHKDDWGWRGGGGGRFAPRGRGRFSGRGRGRGRGRIHSDMTWTKGHGTSSGAADETGGEGNEDQTNNGGGDSATEAAVANHPSPIVMEAFHGRGRGRGRGGRGRFSYGRGGGYQQVSQMIASKQWVRKKPEASDANVTDQGGGGEAET